MGFNKGIASEMRLGSRDGTWMELSLGAKQDMARQKPDRAEPRRLYSNNTAGLWTWNSIARGNKYTCTIF